MAFLSVTGWLQVAQWIVRSSLSTSKLCEEGVWVWGRWGGGGRKGLFYLSRNMIGADQVGVTGYTDEASGIFRSHVYE